MSRRVLAILLAAGLTAWASRTDAQVGADLSHYRSLLASPGGTRSVTPSVGAAVPDDDRSESLRAALEALDRGDAAEAVTRADGAIEAFRKANAPARAAIVTDLRGVAYFRQGRVGLAIDSHEEAWRGLAGIPGPEAEIGWLSAKSNLAAAHLFREDYGAAERLLGEVLGHPRLRRPSLLPLERLIVGRALNNRGLLYFELRRLREARADFDEAQGRTGTDRAGTRLRAEAANNHARVYAFEGQLDRARQKLAEAQGLARSVFDEPLEANILDSLADALISAAEGEAGERVQLLTEALTVLAEAERVEARGDAPAVRIAILTQRGRALAGLQRFAEALVALDVAASMATTRGLPAFARAALTARGDVLRRAGRRAEAIADWRKAVELAERAQARVLRESERDYLKAVEGLYERVASALLEEKDVKGALRFLDRGKAFALAHEMAKREPELADVLAQEKLEGARGAIEQERALRDAQTRASIRGDHTEAGRRARELDDVAKEVGRLVVDLKKEYGNEYSQYYSVDPLSIVDFADRLPPGTLVVTFLIAPDGGVVFLVSREDGVRWKPAPRATRRWVDAAVEDYRRQVARVSGPASIWRIDSWEGDPRWVQLRDATVALYDALLAPVEADLRKASRVVFAPTGQLFYLPLHALGPWDSQAKELRPLITEKVVSYVTKASLLTVAVGPTAARERRLLAFGNPPFAHTDPVLKPLEHAGQEVEKLERLFAGQAVTRRDAAATKREFIALLEQAGPFGFLHLATHGILDPASPADSWLAFDGTSRLAAREIPKYGPYLKSVHLASLSACQTGMGGTNPGTEVMSLAEFFALAHVPSVIATLWPVPSAETQDLMVSFYETLLRQPSLDKAAALQVAQKRFAERPETRHPAFWAAFFLIGDWR